MLARRTVHGWLPLALVAALALVGVLAARSLPDPMATHFGPGGVPDGTIPRLLGLAVAPILAAVAAGFLVGVTRWGRRVNDAWALAGLSYLLLGAAWGLQLGLVASNSGASRASDARLAGTGWLALIVPFAAFGVWSALRCKRLEPVSSASSANVDVAAVGDDIVITMRGADTVWALRRSIRLPRRGLLRAQVADLSSLRPSGLRLPGTEIPGVLRAGSYGRAPNRDFWDVRTGPQVLVLTLADGLRYRRIVVQPRDLDAALAALPQAVT